MKFLSRLFFVLAGVVVLQNPVFGADKCQPQGKDTDPLCYDSYIPVMVGGSGLYWGCLYGDDDHECDGEAIVGQKDSDGKLQKLFICVDRWGSCNQWEEIPDVAFCAATQIRPGSFSGADFECMYSLDGTDVDYSSKVASLPSGGSPCKICKCKGATIPNADGTGCVVDITADKDKCESAPSYGQWDGSVNKCLCGGARTDGKGDGQYDDVPGKTCKCGVGVWNDSMGRCVDPDAECKRTGGTPSGGACQCDKVNKHLVPNADNTACVCDVAGGYIDEAGTGTDETNPLKCQYDEARACAATGGTWNGTECTNCSWSNTEPQMPNKRVCGCQSGYEWIGGVPSARGCQESPGADAVRKFAQACESAPSWGKWNGTECTNCPANMTQSPNKKYCACIDVKYEADYTNKNCRQRSCDVLQKMCNGLGGVKFVSDGSNICECQCTARDKTLRNMGTAANPDWKCVDKYSAPTKSGGVKSGAGAAPDPTLIAEVADLRRDMRRIESGFKTSVWKTAEGNFNGARLASDSIAGVVLGTAGGLITSNIIKKNQVSGGFEDLRCTIGGQVVAGYGDVFNVGVR